jgi:hypothetical protein
MSAFDSTGPSGTNEPLIDTFTGPTGPTGLMEYTGLTGPTGPSELTGLTGPTGLIGPIGLIGLTGLIGPIGLIGLTGLTGSGPSPFNGLTYVQFYRWGNNSTTVEHITPISLDARIHKETPVEDSPKNSHRTIVYIDEETTMLDIVTAFGFSLDSINTIYNPIFGLYVQAGVTNFLTNIYPDNLLTPEDLSKPLFILGIPGDSTFEFYVS